MPFTDNELVEMYSCFVPNKLWIKAFDIYNSNSSHKRLSYGCRPCFNKVLSYILKIRFKTE